MVALDEAIAEQHGGGQRGPNQADILIDLAGAAELFHSPDETAFADVTIKDHRETWLFLWRRTPRPSYPKLSSNLRRALRIFSRSRSDRPKRPEWQGSDQMLRRASRSINPSSWRKTAAVKTMTPRTPAPTATRSSRDGFLSSSTGWPVASR